MPEFIVIGLSYKKANEKIRGMYSLNEKQQEFLLDTFLRNHSYGFIISTCNRTEVYTFTNNVDKLYAHWSNLTHTKLDELKAHTQIHYGKEARHHLFEVSCGLDSQILGDFEITNQLKKAVAFAKNKGTINGFLERLINTTLQASKSVRSSTKISNGTTSVSYVTVNYIKNHIPNYDNKNILLYGLGEIGKLTIENLYKHLPPSNLAIINRTGSKSKKIAEKYIIREFEHKNLNDAISKAEILIVATNANQPTITKENFTSDNNITVFDLSIPMNVAENVSELGHVTKLGLDELSKTINETIATRQQEVPTALKIIEKYENEFDAWFSHQVFADLTKSFKNKMIDIKTNEIAYHKKKLDTPNEEHLHAISDRIIQKLTSKVVTHLKKESNRENQLAQIDLIKQMFQL